MGSTASTELLDYKISLWLLLLNSLNPLPYFILSLSLWVYLVLFNDWDVFTCITLFSCLLLGISSWAETYIGALGVERAPVNSSGHSGSLLYTMAYNLFNPFLLINTSFPFLNFTYSSKHTWHVSDTLYLFSKLFVKQ